ncbi:gpW family head-tail joining protein [Yersinia pseudotuberculosis]|uniref:gpW family head-tail joining protein n=1 Tax=Yersinia pseudotuberculosis TaxID=633 RepID=UPI0004F60C73|nr:gpW family head-tail joining protein [Yersinia pseudotuberculosis]AIN15189.1 gpW family protein [Yersinia pseudotuberculosis]
MSQYLSGDETVSELKAILKSATSRMRDIAFGDKGISFSYAQGDGTRSVTYQTANIEDLRALIAEVNAKLGKRTRSALRFRY